jgi:hypothetical protein
MQFNGMCRLLLINYGKAGRKPSRLRHNFLIWLAIMASLRSEDEFVRKLRELEGQDFEDEICAFLQKCVTDYQTVPALPHGDAGLDGHSHGQSHAYCCYGPEASSKSTAAKLKPAIINKFRSDLRKLFELETQGNGRAAKLVHCETVEMKTILAPGKKLTVIRLIVSVFESHQILAPLNEAFEEYKKASHARYVDKQASLTVWGPKQLATMGAVDDLMLVRLEQREILRRVAEVIGSAPQMASPSSDFDAKFDWLDSQGKVSQDTSRRLRAHFRKRWGVAVAIEDELANNAVSLHAALAPAREEAATDADLASGTASNPRELIERMRQKIAERLDEHFGLKFPTEMRNQLVDGELARLIGECPIDWRPI